MAMLWRTKRSSKICRTQLSRTSLSTDPSQLTSNSSSSSKAPRCSSCFFSPFCAPLAVDGPAASTDLSFGVDCCGAAMLKRVELLWFWFGRFFRAQRFPSLLMPMRYRRGLRVFVCSSKLKVGNSQVGTTITRNPEADDAMLELVKRCRITRHSSFCC